MVVWVFVYGTLLKGESNHSIIAPHILQAEPGRLKGRLYDIGPYPALVLDANGVWVEGEWNFIRSEGLKDLDALEGYHEKGQNNEYERVWVMDADSGRSGWVYVYPDSRGYPGISGSSWRRWKQKSTR